MHTMIIVFFVWIFLTCFIAWSQGESLKDWVVFASWLVMLFLLTDLVNSPRRLVLYRIGFIVINFKCSAPALVGQKGVVE